jgi:hypothetical protein
LVVANNQGKTLSILLGNGDGTFQAHVDDAAPGGPLFVLIADFNNVLRGREFRRRGQRRNWH